jgi:putative two-component system response regulator
MSVPAQQAGWSEAAVADARLVIIDDLATNVELLEQILTRAGYRHILSTTRASEAVEFCLARQPDLLLLDLRMPDLDGFGVLELLAPLRHGADRFPVLVLTGDSSIQTRRRALTAGADDFLVKPIDRLEVVLRVRNMVEKHRLEVALRDENLRLEIAVRERTAELELARAEILHRLALATEFRDDDTHEHAQRIGRSAARLASAMGVDENTTRTIARAAPLHDIGKLAISDNILLKPGSLTEAEYTIMKTHTSIGAEMLAGSNSSVLRAAEEIAMTHHERWNGGGYPHSLAEEDIPLSGRIVAVADVFDALTHVRPYKLAWPIQKAVDEVLHEGGRRFDPRVVDAFMTFDHAALLASVEGS